MKKFLILIISFLLIFLVACEKNATTISTTISTDTLTEVFGFDNPTNQSKAEIKLQIDGYIERIEELSSLENSELTETGFNDFSNLILLEYGQTLYDRDDIPNYKHDYNNEELLNYFFLLNTSQMLLFFDDALEACDAFAEDDYCTTSIENTNTNYKLLVRGEGDKLYLELYNYTYSDLTTYQYTEIATNIMYFDIIDDELYFEYIREYQGDFSGNKEHMCHYDRFYESGDILNVSLNLLDHSNIYYQQYEKETADVFLLSGSEEGYFMNYKGGDSDVFYSIGINPLNEIDVLNVIYGTYDPSLSYKAQGNNVTIGWNLFDIAGWNKALVDDNQDDQIFIDDLRVLEDFRISIEIQEGDTDVSVRYSTNKEAVTESLIDLTAYGLLFDEVSFTQLQTDITYINNSFNDIIEAKGFDPDLASNYDDLYEMFPMFSNPEVIAEIEAWFLTQQE